MIALSESMILNCNSFLKKGGSDIMILFFMDNIALRVKQFLGFRSKFWLFVHLSVNMYEIKTQPF